MTSPTTEQRHRRTLWVVIVALVVLLVLFAGIAIGSHRRAHDHAGQGTVTLRPKHLSPGQSVPAANGSGLLVEPAPASTDGGHVGPAGIRIGFDHSCRGAVEAATAYTEIGPLDVQLFAPGTTPKKVSASIFSSSASATDKALVETPVSFGTGEKAAFAKDPWAAYPSWGGFRVRSCMPAATARVDVWSCVFRTNPMHQPDPTNAAGRSCSTTSYALEWESSDWKIQSFDATSNAPTSDDFSSPDRTPLTMAQRATVVGVVPGWQEYADAPR